MIRHDRVFTFVWIVILVGMTLLILIGGVIALFTAPKNWTLFH